MAYSDKHGEFFGRLNHDGDVMVLHVEDGLPATRHDAAVYPIGSARSARYEHAAGIVLVRADAASARDRDRSEQYKWPLSAIGRRRRYQAWPQADVDLSSAARDKIKRRAAGKETQSEIDFKADDNGYDQTYRNRY